MTPETRDKLLTLPQYFVPQHLLSRAVGWLAESRYPLIKNTFIDFFARRYQVNMKKILWPTKILMPFLPAP